MIKVNLLPIKKKKKAKPLPGFLITTVFVTLASIAIMAYLIFLYGSKLSSKEDQVAENDKKIEELTKKIKAVENYEKLNADYNKRKEIIEQLGKSKTLPVRVLDEMSSLLPSGIWLNTMKLNDADVSLAGTGFTNTDVVNFVNNLKSSKLFTEVYLQESMQAQVSGFPVYSFRITLKVKV